MTFNTTFSSLLSVRLSTRLLAAGLFGVAFLLGGVAYAQSFYYSGTPASASCVNITRNLSLGSRGADVTALQQFLVARNYPGSGSWMVTGYFGRATQAAVRNFQTEQRLSVTGSVDLQTRMAIDRVSCGGVHLDSLAQPTFVYAEPFRNFDSPQYTYPGGFSYQYSQPPLNYNNNYYYGLYPFTHYQNSPTINSLSTTSGYPGTTLTITGTGFDVTNNTVYFGTTPVIAYTSSASSLIVAVPSTISGTVQVYVQNARGTSNNKPFTITTGYSNNYDYYNYPNNYTYPYNYYGQNYGCGAYYSGSQCCGIGSDCPLQITYLNPSTGSVGATVSILGTGFSQTGNTVRFGVGIIAGLTSPDGRSLTFTVPAQLSGYGSQSVVVGQYPVSVSDNRGRTSNTVAFTVTSLGTTGGAPTITSVSGPTSIAANVNGVWTLTVNNLGSTYTTASVSWGDPMYGTYASAPQQVLGSGIQTITFSHAYAQTGTFIARFTVTNSQGQSNTSTVTVNVTAGSQSGAITLSSISPNVGHIGTQVILMGSNFSMYDNTVHFGQGGTLHVPSINGTTIYYTIPYAVSPCDLIGPGCAAPTTIVSAGQYPVYVTNSSGTSATLYATVQ